MDGAAHNEEGIPALVYAARLEMDARAVSINNARGRPSFKSITQTDNA